MSALHETKQHGKLSFPFTVYSGRIPEWLTYFPLHWHDEMELIYVQNGRMAVTVQGDEIVLSEGEIACIQPQLVHSIRQYENDSVYYNNILFRLSLLENNTRDLCYEKYFQPVYSGKMIIPRYISSENELNGVLKPYIQQLISFRYRSENGIELIIKSGLFAIMHYLCSMSKPEDQQEQYINSLYDKLKRSISFIKNNYNDNITVEKAAALCNFSTSHFSKMFRELTGSSFIQYLKNYRLEIAAEKLTGEGKSVSTAAMECGFNNLSYFTRAFSEKYSCSPRKYVKNYESVKNKHTSRKDEI